MGSLLQRPCSSLLIFAISEVFLGLNLVLLFTLVAEICLFTASRLKLDLYLGFQAAKVIFVHEEYRRLAVVEIRNLTSFLALFALPFVAALVCAMVFKALSLRSREGSGDVEEGSGKEKIEA